MVDLRLTRPLPPTTGGVRPPAAVTAAATLSPSVSPSKTGVNGSPVRFKIEQSEEVQLTPEQIRKKRAGEFFDINFFYNHFMLLRYLYFIKQSF